MPDEDTLYQSVCDEVGERRRYIPAPRTALVTPGNGFTSGIVALFWAYVGSRTVTLIPSRTDYWTPSFCSLLQKEDPTSVTIVDKNEYQDSFTTILKKHSHLVVYGSDKTIDYYRELWSSRENFLGYGSKTSIIVHDRPIWTSRDSQSYLNDLVAYDGFGCLNPTVLYTTEWTREIREGVSQLADLVSKHYEYSSVTPEWTRFRTANAMDLKAIESIGPFVVRNTAHFPTTEPTRGFGTLYVVPEAPVEDILSEWEGTSLISTVVLNSAVPDVWTHTLPELGASRITLPGQAQRPPLNWSHDNSRNLLPLVKLVDCEL